MTLTVPLGLLLLSAPFGLYLAVRHLRGGSAPLGAALVHGLFAAAGLGVLAYLLFQAGFAGKPAAALGVLAVAALGGFVLFSARLRAKSPAAGLIVVHALAALAGVGVLALAVLGR